MTMKVIPVYGGLVTSRDPSTLAEGELTRADDGYYKPNHPGLWKVKGKTKFNTTALDAAILALSYVEWDGADAAEFFVYKAANVRLHAARAALTGTLAEVVMPGAVLNGFPVIPSTTQTMDSIHYNNQHFLLIGATSFAMTSNNASYPSTKTGQNLWIQAPSDRVGLYLSDGEVRLHGMLENTAANTVTNAGAGTGFTLTSGATVKYWIEERYKVGSAVLKRSPASPATVVTLTGTGANVKPLFTRVTPTANQEYTHWGVFATATNGSFPNGFEVGEATSGVTTIEDLRTGTDPGAPAGVAYEKITVSIASITSSIAKWGTPPVATTGDVFKESLVTNDVANPSYVPYSFAGEPHAFPALNLIKFNTKIRDEVVLIRTVGEVVLVCLESSAWRINDLPRPEDSAFALEDVREIIAGAFGCVGPKAGVAFQSAAGHRAAYVSLYGIVVTDGYTFDTVSDDIDWEATVDVSQLSDSVLVDNPRLWRLEFYYTPVGATRNTRALYLHYHKSHAKDVQDTDDPTRENFRLKISGPIQVEANAAVLAKVSGVHEVFTANQDGRLYLENSGNTDTSPAGGIDFVCRTAELPLAGPGNHATVRAFWTHHSAGVTDQEATAKAIVLREGNADEEVTHTIPMDRRESTSAYKETQGETHQFGLENSDALGSFSVDYFIVDFDSEGRTEEEGA